MNETQRAKIILKILNKIYPSIKVPLKSRNVFTLLISVLLSAQCTDVNVNNVTSKIYPKYHQPKHFVKLGRKKIERLIKKIGIFRIKAKSIYNLSKILIEKHKGKVPKTFNELEKLLLLAKEEYYNGEPVIKDSTFDIMEETLRRADPGSPYFDNIGAPVRKDVVKVKLPSHMGSLDKIKPDTDALEKWMKKYGPS